MARFSGGLLMKGVAHISFEGGGSFLPAQTPYERELLIEHVEVSARGRGSVGLDLNGRRWTVSSKNGHGEACASCDRWPEKLTFRFDGQTLCGQCARRVLQ
jgi:hypothetical protein